LGQPLLFLLALDFGFTPVFQKAGEGNYIQFLAPGIMVMGVIFMAVFSGIEIIWDREFGFMKETLVAPVPRYKIMLGKTFGGATVATFQGLIMLLLSFFVGFKLVNVLALPLAFVCMFIIAFLFTALGILIASRMRDMHGFQLIVNFLIMPIFFLSGALFSLNGLPPAIQTIAALDPLSYGVDCLRFSFGGITHFGLLFDFIVLIVVSLLFLALGSYFFEKIEI
jgi:ABC-2 type transport system permease protein